MLREMEERAEAKVSKRLTLEEIINIETEYTRQVVITNKIVNTIVVMLIVSILILFLKII